MVEDTSVFLNDSKNEDFLVVKESGTEEIHGEQSIAQVEKKFQAFP
ncbi:hypothetical protein [Chryseobacterium hagamense]|uniref:Uncharacterized protein n=1 Tax=Chryseobacterium hagamense TaxID=395935 RepID=A0A511YSR1_9FLAO|nr:hypothetical protein [Chryseobacterium hagamense]GEN78239.1 hypothetical protein CHA01nite_39790 [Chryseobacterium hagamense]